MSAAFTALMEMDHQTVVEMCLRRTDESLSLARENAELRRLLEEARGMLGWLRDILDRNPDICGPDAGVIFGRIDRAISGQSTGGES